MGNPKKGDKFVVSSGDYEGLELIYLYPSSLSATLLVFEDVSGNRFQFPLSRVEPVPQESSNLGSQVGGNHYKKLKIQPAEYSEANKLSFLQGNAIKYITRFRDKNGKEDLNKAIHCIELLKELEYENSDS